MNTIDLFNRVVMILLLLALIAVTGVLMIIPQVALRLLAQQLEFVGNNLTFAGRVVILVLGVILLLICVFLLWLEVRRPARRTVQIPRVSGGQAEMSTESVAQRLAYNLDQLQDVVRVEPHVGARGKKVEVSLDVETSPDIDVPSKTDEIVQEARRVIEERMGLELADIRVNVEHAPFPKEPRRPSREAAGPTTE